MRKNITLTVVTLALAGLCGIISLIAVRAAAPSLLASHAGALAAGMATLAAIVAMGTKRLSLAGLAISLCVIGLCLCCFIEKSDYGFNRKIVVFGQQILDPAFFLPPSLILLFAWGRRMHRGTPFFIAASVATLTLAALMPRLSEATLILFLAAAMYGLAVRIRYRKAIWCLIAAAIAFSPLAVREIKMQMSGRSWFGPNSHIGLYTDYSLYRIGKTPWIRSTESPRTRPPIGKISENVLGHASYYCGNWTLAALAVALALLAACLVAIARRARTSPQKIFAYGGAIALMAQMVLGVLHFLFRIPRHLSFVPFASTGSCHTVACFALLGFALATLRNDSLRPGKTMRGHRIDICVCGAIPVAIAAAAGMLAIHRESLPKTKIARMVPKSAPGFFFSAENGTLTNGAAIVPVKKFVGIGEPSVVSAVEAFRNGERIWREDIDHEPPIVAARSRIRPDGRIALDCRDLFEDEFTLVFDLPSDCRPTSETSAPGERWEIFLDPQGHLGCTNLWTDLRVAQGISQKLNLDFGFVSNAISRTDSRYIRLKTTSDPDEISFAKRYRRFWRLVIVRKDPTPKKQ
jgi:cell division protein FtsW (lipid II flippase)